VDDEGCSVAEPFLAEIRMVGFNFAPPGWAFCNGQILPINQNQSLYSLLGTTYGGDGETSFALPDLRGRTPMHWGNGHLLGQKGGAEAVTLSSAEMPTHRHRFRAAAVDGDQPVAADAALAGYNNGFRGDGIDLIDLRADTIANSGGGQAHNNMQPYQAINFCIALQGLFPS
jgi:microcystin-dependent protein